MTWVQDLHHCIICHLYDQLFLVCIATLADFRNTLYDSLSPFLFICVHITSRSIDDSKAVY